MAVAVAMPIPAANPTCHHQEPAAGKAAHPVAMDDSNEESLAAEIMIRKGTYRLSRHIGYTLRGLLLGRGWAYCAGCGIFW